MQDDFWKEKLTTTIKRYMKKNQEKYLYNATQRIIAYAVGMAIGANIQGLSGKEFHFDNSERGREEIEKEVMKLFKYAINSGKI